MTINRWERQYQVLLAIEFLESEDKPTTVRNITEYLKDEDSEITINIINSSVRHYRKNRLLKRKHPYCRPFHYILSKKGKEQLEWLENGEYEYYFVI